MVGGAVKMGGNLEQLKFTGRSDFFSFGQKLANSWSSILLNVLAAVESLIEDLLVCQCP